MEQVLDIFNNDAFSAIELNDKVINKIDYKPQLLGSLGLFEPVYSRSRTIAIVKTESGMTMIPTSEIGAPPAELVPTGSDVRTMNTHRLAKGSSIYAYELQGVLNMPLGMQLKEVQQEVADRTAKIQDDMELTWEHMRLGAVLGTVYDSDNSRVLQNWYTEWGITPAAEVDFLLGTATTDIRQKVRAMMRSMQIASKGAWTPRSRMVALVGDSFFDKLLAHAAYKETRLQNNRTGELEDIAGYSAIVWEGVTWINYRGTDDGTSLSIPTNKAKFFPVGARGVFQVGWAPAEFFPYVNQRGQPRYLLTLPDTSGRNAYRRVEMYSYPLFTCTRPDMLMTATTSN